MEKPSKLAKDCFRGLLILLNTGLSSNVLHPSGSRTVRRRWLTPTLSAALPYSDRTVLRSSISE